MSYCTSKDKLYTNLEKAHQERNYEQKVSNNSDFRKRIKN